MNTISIIGAGTMATAIAGRVAKAGHTVEVITRDVAKAQALVSKLDARAVSGTYGAAPLGNIVVLAVPYGSVATVAADFGGALDGKVIIDIANPVNADMTGLATPAGSSGAQETAKTLPSGAHVVKAFNTIFGHVLTQGDRLDAFIAGDNAEAKARVSTFLGSLGLRPMDVGGMHMAMTLEAPGLMMIGLAKNGAGSWNLAIKAEIG
ncbi:putative dinucleotide-binding enzyme [Puniceibacterium sp. IMCC21224]|nr:putative dinucleotide-binding enzyme [Puniceibacterium sp. IMCC21224]